MNKTTGRIVAIGASMGGIQALELILTHLPPICPGLVIVQHMPEKFTASLEPVMNYIALALRVKKRECEA